MAIISLMILVPILTSLLAWLFGKKRAYAIALAGSLITLIISLYILTNFDTSVKSYQFLESYKWIPSIGASVIWGIDGLSMAMVILTTSLFFIAILVARHLVKDNIRYFCIVFMLMESFILGVFVSLDLLVFYIFWDLVILAMFFTILLWGGPNKKYAAIKFLIYTGIASFVMLVSLIAIYLQSGLGTFDVRALTAAVYPQAFSYIVFSALFFSFIVKMPVFPFHTWLPDAHVEAPTPASIILAGLLLKMGAYGLLRIPYSIFPSTASSLIIYIAILAGISVVYGAAVSIVQKDLKRMIAFSSVMHMGLVLLGISTLSRIGFNGAIYEMVSHGIVAALGFSIAGFIHEKIGTRIIGKFSGLSRALPRVGWTLVIVALATFGLPSTSGFPAEFLVFISSYLSYGLYTLIVLAGSLILAAGFIWMLEKTCFGNRKIPVKSAKDMKYSEYLPFAMLLVLLLFFGLYPQFLINIINSFSQGLVFLR